MSVQPTIAVQPASQRRWLVAGIGALALAGAIAVVLVFAFRSSDQTSPSVTPAGPSAAQDASRVTPVSSLTPIGLATGALGTGYALPTTQHGPSLASVLASMDPQARRYTQTIMALTFNQLAAGAAGQP